MKLLFFRTVSVDVNGEESKLDLIGKVLRVIFILKDVYKFQFKIVIVFLAL